MKKLILLLIPIAIIGCMTTTEPLDNFSDGASLFDGGSTSADFKWSASSDWTFEADYSSMGTSVIGKKVSFIDSDGNVLFQNRIASFKESYSFKGSPETDELILFIPSIGLSNRIVANTTLITVEKASSNGRMASASAVTCDCESDIVGLTTLTINKDDVLCITNGFTGSIFFSGAGTLNICSDATLLNIYGNKEGVINIGSDANVAIGNWTNNDDKDAIINYGRLTFGGSLSLNKGTIENYGSVEVKGSFSQNSGNLANDGSFIVRGSASINNKDNVNNGYMSIDGSFSINNSGELESYCQLVANGGLSLDGKLGLGGSSLLNVKSDFTINSSGQLTLDGTNILAKSEKLTLNGKIDTQESNNLLSVSGQFTANSSGSISGNKVVLGLCVPNYDFSNKKIEAEAGCEYSIPVSECNPYGVNTTQDSDNDGCPDDEDEFPNDPSRCYTVADPATGYKVIAFEDLWPYRGDYDFNDLVLKSRTIFTKNASNQFVEADHTFIIQSVGASLSNGIGVHYLKKSQGTFSEPSNVVINNLEVEGQQNMTAQKEKNVVIVSEDVFGSLSSYYMNNGVGPSKSPDTLRFVTSFDASQTANLVADVFIFRSNDPGLEIHLPDVLPTSLVKKDYFGTGHDATNQSNLWYRTNENLPWAMEIYLNDGEEYYVPNEAVIITDAYPDFAEWAASGGTKNQTWNRNYREDKVYQ